MHTLADQSSITAYSPVPWQGGHVFLRRMPCTFLTGRIIFMLWIMVWLSSMELMMYVLKSIVVVVIYIWSHSFRNWWEGVWFLPILLMNMAVMKRWKAKLPARTAGNQAYILTVLIIRTVRNSFPLWYSQRNALLDLSFGWLTRSTFVSREASCGSLPLSH